MESASDLNGSTISFRCFEFSFLSHLLFVFPFFLAPLCPALSGPAWGPALKMGPARAVSKEASDGRKRGSLVTRPTAAPPSLRGGPSCSASPRASRKREYFHTFAPAISRATKAALFLVHRGLVWRGRAVSGGRRREKKVPV